MCRCRLSPILYRPYKDANGCAPLKSYLLHWSDMNLHCLAYFRINRVIPVLMLRLLKPCCASSAVSFFESGRSNARNTGKSLTRRLMSSSGSLSSFFLDVNRTWHIPLHMSPVILRIYATGGTLRSTLIKRKGLSNSHIWE